MARLLEGGEQPGELSAALTRGAGDLRAVVSSLPEASRRSLEARFGAAGLAELLSLAAERDPALFGEALLNLGTRQEQAGRIELAANALTLLAGEGTPWGTALQQRARARLDAILGRGAFGGRAEFLARRFAQEACEPTALLAMGAAGAAFKLTRLATLSRLAATPTTNFLTRGFGARALASLTGFAVEATVFPMTGRLANEALGRSQDWSLSAVGRDLASSFIVLGAMKGTGWLAGASFNRLHGINPLTGQATRLAGLSGFSQRLFPQVGMLGGILLGHRVEERLGLREHVDGATTLVDSLAMLLQFNVAGRLTQHAFGPGFHAWEQGLERQTELLAQRSPSGSGLGLASLMTMGPELATPNGVRISAAETGAEPERGSGLRMTMLGEGGRDLPPSEPPRGGSGGDGGDGGGRRPPTGTLAEARRQLEIFREHRDREDQDSIVTFSRALRYLRENPEVAREALIGRSDLSTAHLDEIFRAIAPEGHRVLTNPNLQRVLIPNRGEIALRLARGLRAEGLTPVVLVPEPEANALWARQIRESGGEIRVVGGATAAEAYQNAYLNIPRILTEAHAAGVQAVHPGYGYRSESPEFARALEREGIVLMGPSVRSMERAGDKDIAKQAFIAAGVPVVPGTRQGYTEVEGLLAELRQLGMIRGEELAFPIRLKAVAGGGGRGQRTVRSLQELRDIFPRLSAEAQVGFGNGSIMAERFIERFHHVEFQIMADRFGNVVHLGERECTLQERNQKLIEIHPAAIFERFPGLRERMAEASLNAARAMNYTGHGTVEFMVDPETGDFFAMEVNARIQVEHRVSEAVTGFDLIREAVRVARGLPLSRSQAEIQPRGAAVEVRIKAVDPNRRDRDGNAAPAPGLVEDFTVLGTSDFDALAAQGIFVETSVRAGDRVSPNADPMIAKLIVTADTRAQAIARAADVLSRTVLRGSQGFASDLPRQLSLLRTRAAQRATYDNRFVDEWTRVGGENYSVFPHRQATLLGAQFPLLHLEVGSEAPLPSNLAERQASSLSLLLHGAESALELPLQGPLAGLLRGHETLADSLLQGSGRRGMWAQTSAEGELRQLAVFRDHRPERILFTRTAPMPQGGGEQRYAETPLIYDIQFSPEGNAVQSVSLYRQGEARPLIALTPGDAMFQNLRGGSEYQFFVQPGATTPVALGLRLIPAGSHRGVEIRDRSGNILLSLNPERVMESPADRLLSLFEFSGNQVPAHIRQASETQIRALVEGMARLPRGNPSREAFVETLGHTPVSLVRRLLRLAGESRSLEDQQLLDEIIARREVSGFSQRHRFDSYEVLDGQTSLVRFAETGAEGPPLPRQMIRIRAEAGADLPSLVRRALSHLAADRAAHPGTRDGVIQIVTRDLQEPQLADVAQTLNFAEQVRSAVAGAEAPADLGLKRLTLVVDRPSEYPEYFTFRRALDASGTRRGRFEEDLRYRNLHPMLAHLIELWRLRDFNYTRDQAHSDRFSHVFFAANRKTSGLEAGQDQRLIGKALIPEAEVQRAPIGDEIRIPQVEAAFERLLTAAHGAMEAREGRRPFWNRLELFIQPILHVSDAQVAAYAESLSLRYQDRLRGLGLEKVVVKAWLRDSRLPEGHRNILVRITNPTGYRFEPKIDNVVRARVAASDGSVTTREVLLNNGAYERWLGARLQGDSNLVIPHGEWAPADIPIKPATPAELREAQARARGAMWAYRIPDLIADTAERFRNAHSEHRQERPLGSERPPAAENSLASHWQELELESPQSVDPRTGMVDPNHGTLVPAVDRQGRPRPEGENQAGVVIGVQTDHLGTGVPVRRVVILGDLTHASRGSLSANECARINAAIRYAAEQGIPVDWFTASSGAEIHERRGVEGLDATASTVREIVRHAHSLGVPINLVVSDVNIGAQSYWNSLAAIVQDTGGVLIMTPRGSMALTGPDAWTAAMLRDIHSEDLPGAARRFYPNGLQSLAGYQEVHGPNGEAMALAPDLAAATELLLRHHYFTSTYRGELVSARVWGHQDPFERDITRQDSGGGRQVGDEITAILTGRSGNREAILEALRDVGSPAPVRWWADAQGIRHQPDGNGLMRQRPTSIIQEMQIGGRPTLVIFPALGPLTPADSNLIGRAIEKANGRLPVLLIGSLSGFNGDPRSMENGQLAGGARIAQAIVRHRGPITVVNMGYIVGGTYVVVSKQLNPHLRMLALEGSHAQVIGGPSAAKVVFRSRIRAAADRDPRVLRARESLEGAPASDRARLETELQNVRRAVILELEQAQAGAFDSVHSVQRAQEVGSVDEVISPSALRAAVIRHREEALNQYRLDREREAALALDRSADQVTAQPGTLALQALWESLVRVHGPERARELARAYSEGLRNFAGGDPESGPDGEPPSGAEGGGSAAPP
ncbi:MAG: biotin carboxylase N-terminal domain-containing protein [bacterium]